MLTAFDLRQLHVGLAADLERYAIACAMAEVMLRFAPPDPHPESFEVLRDALMQLESIPGASVQALGFRLLWQLVSVLGFEPSVDACVIDGTPLPEQGPLPFSTRDGGALCTVCAVQRGATQLPEQDRADLIALIAPGATLPPGAGPQARGGAPPTAGAVHPVPSGRRGQSAGPGVLDGTALGGGMIIGTAGHIDHGKSTLVTALTGRPMDRLAEERRREITIELNFAPLELSNGKVAGMIDVPGHEDFVRTMVAGASGIDLALLVIAADEGLMPQTEEHLLILEQLGIERGIAVITKIDLVEADWLQLVMLETAERLAGSSIRVRRAAGGIGQNGAGASGAQTGDRRARPASRPPSGPRCFPYADRSGVLTSRCGNGGHRDRLVRASDDWRQRHRSTIRSRRTNQVAGELWPPRRADAAGSAYRGGHCRARSR